MTELRPYQQRDADAILAKLAPGKGVLYQLATGGGKTQIFTHIVAALGDHRACILVHRRELLRQAAAKLEAVGVRAGIVAAGSPMDLRDRVHVASIDTLSRRIDRLRCWISSLDLVVVDEAHHIGGAATWSAVVSAADRACILGCTATPWRLDGKPLAPFFHDIHQGPSISKLTADGYLCPAVIHAPPGGIDLKSVKRTAGDYNKGELAALMDRHEVTMQAVHHYAHFAAGLPTIAFCASVDHAKHAAEQFSSVGWRARSIDGSISPQERDQVFADLASGNIQILTSCELISEGVDVPVVGAAIMLRPTMSTGLWMQQCLDSETEILTRRGWLRHDHITHDDVVAGWDHGTGSIEWCRIDDVVSRPLAGGESMFRINSPHLDIRVTGAHDMVVRCRSQTSRHWRKEAADRVALRRQMFIVPVSGDEGVSAASLTDAEIEFLGWFLTDGCKDKSNNSIRICQSSSKISHLNEIRRVIDGCGFKYGEHIIVRRDAATAGYPDLVQFYISKGKPRGRDKHLRGWGCLEDWVDKSIPAIYDTLDRRQFGLLLRSMNLGDGNNGSKTENWTRRTITITTGDNEEMADRIQSLCVRRAFRCNKAVTHTIGRAPQFFLHIRDTSTATISGAGCTDGEISGKKYKRSRFVEDKCTPGEAVWCVSNRLGTIITRRNGKVAIVGNCGRVLRPHRLKKHAVIIDCAKNAMAHGLPESERKWTLAAGLMRPPIGPAVVRCGKRGCWRVCAVGTAVCPSCGTRLASKATAQQAEIPQFIGGIHIDRIMAMKGFDLARMPFSDRDLRAIANVKGYKPGWVFWAKETRAGGFGRRSSSSSRGRWR